MADTDGDMGLSVIVVDGEVVGVRLGGVGDGLREVGEVVPGLRDRGGVFRLGFLDDDGAALGFDVGASKVASWRSS